MPACIMQKSKKSIKIYRGAEKGCSGINCWFQGKGIISDSFLLYAHKNYYPYNFYFQHNIMCYHTKQISSVTQWISFKSLHLHMKSQMIREPRAGLLQSFPRSCHVKIMMQKCAGISKIKRKVICISRSIVVLYLSLFCTNNSNVNVDHKGFKYFLFAFCTLSFLRKSLNF